MKVVTLTSKNQVTIPAAVVRQLGLNKTRRLVVEQRGKELVLKPEPTIEEIMAPFYAKIKPRLTRPLSETELNAARRAAWQERARRLAPKNKQN